MKNVTFHGSINHDQVPFFIAISDLIALTSESEGLPTILVEAMSCGIPVITTNVGGVSDIISDGITGFIANNDDEYKEKLEYILKNDVRDEMAEKILAQTVRLTDDQAIMVMTILYQLNYRHAASYYSDRLQVDHARAEEILRIRSI